MTDLSLEERIQRLEAKGFAHGGTLRLAISELFPDALIRNQIRDGFLRALRQIDVAAASFPPQVAIDEVENMFS